MRRALLAVALVVLLAGCTAPQATGDRGTPATDRIGYHDGYWYDDDLPFVTDGSLNETEREAVVARAMARVEYVRERNFRQDVTVRVIDRAEYLASRSVDVDETRARWNNQVWKGLFVVGADRDVNEVFNQTYGQAVAGYYSPGTGDVVIVSDDPDPSLRAGTLAHELLHALQDQHFGLGSAPMTQDRQLGWFGLVEGEANAVQYEYLDRCGVEWSCVSGAASGAGGAVDPGVYLVVYQPYASGPGFVETLRDRDGWRSVDRAHADPPASSQQVVRPDRYPADRPVDVRVADRSNDDWRRFDHDPVGDTLGEASIYAMFVANDVVSPVDGRYSYRHAVSDGWAGDQLVPYRDGDRDGYVWEIEWETREDAADFAKAYRQLLVTHDAERRGDGIFVVPDPSPFADAFHLTRDGGTVRIVNGPTVESLSAIHGR